MAVPSHRRFIHRATSGTVVRVNEPLRLGYVYAVAVTRVMNPRQSEITRSIGEGKTRLGDSLELVFPSGKFDPTSFSSTSRGSIKIVVFAVLRQRCFHLCVTCARRRTGWRTSGLLRKWQAAPVGCFSCGKLKLDVMCPLQGIEGCPHCPLGRISQSTLVMPAHGFPPWSTECENFDPDQLRCSR